VNAERKVDVIGTIRRHGKVFAVGEGLAPQETYTRQGAILDDRARAYWSHMGYSNQLGLLKYALTHAGIRGLTLPEPQPSLDFGYYYPDGGAGRVFATWDQLAAWKQRQGKARPGAPRIAIGFYKATYYGGETELLDAVIAEIERRGAEAIPMFGYPGAVAAERLLLDGSLGAEASAKAAGRARADAILCFNFNFAGPGDSSYLAKVDVPVLNLISLYGRSEKEWRESPMGLSFFVGPFGSCAMTVVVDRRIAQHAIEPGDGALFVTKVGASLQAPHESGLQNILRDCP
jgi:cobaltochelatase CobN